MYGSYGRPTGRWASPACAPPTLLRPTVPRPPLLRRGRSLPGRWAPDGVAMLNAWVEEGAQAWLANSLATLRAWKSEQVALCTWAGLATRT